VPAPEGPFGAKGVGEAPGVGVPGAVANAVAAATAGARVRRLPMTPERVWRALVERGAPV
jgi:CO/xanthine dehydrogenase Mo-binding subunit